MSRFLAKLRIIVTVLLMAVVVTLPVLEAAACSSESTTHQSGALVGPMDTQHGDDDGQHGLCVHSHCHHSSATVLPDFAVDRGIDLRQHLVLMHAQVLQASAAVDGLMRPPRI